ncbi:MAG: glycosyltransferase family 4 protein [Bacteroidota bacterium]|nr:glycosyltransferase family 4 protein [Bacteroidota bacterium]
MRVLILSNKVPWPAKDGGAIATQNMIFGLQQAGVQTSLVALNTLKHRVNINDLPAAYHNLHILKLVEVDTNVKPLAAFINLFTQDSYHISRFNVPEVSHQIINLLSHQQFDIIHIEGLHMACYLPTLRQYSNAKIVLRAHNVEHLIWNRLAGNEKHWLRRWYLNLLSQRLETFEWNAFNQADGIIPITLVDAEYIQARITDKLINVSPTGIDLNKYTYRDDNNYSSFACFHLGALDWIPNREGLEWFIAKVWPAVIQQLPNAHFHIAGRHIPEYILNMKVSSIIVHGEINDAQDFMNNHGVMIIPLHSGSGMRIKILEGLALGIPMVSTTIGAEGIGISHGKNILIADDYKEMAITIISLLQQKFDIQSIRHNARALAGLEYNNKQIMSKLLTFYKEL